MEAKKQFFQKLTNRILVTLLLSVAFPVFCAAFFPIFTFLILPSTSLISGGMAASPPWLYIYWLVAAGAWIILLGAVLPLMRKDLIISNNVPIDEESKIDLKRLNSRGSRDVLEEEDSKDNLYDGNDVRKSKSISETDVLLNESRLYSGETEASVHEANTDFDSPDTRKEPKSSETIKASKHVLSESIKIPHSEEEEEEFIPSLGANDVMEDEFSAETVISKSYTHRTQRIDTITSSEETYECSLPSPAPASEGERSKNAVFIFVNNGDDKNATNV